MGGSLGLGAMAHPPQYPPTAAQSLSLVSAQHLAEALMQSILLELRAQKSSVEPSCRHALCRVYVGLCRQLGDLERARLFCYSLLKEGASGAVGAVCGCGVWRPQPC